MKNQKQYVLYVATIDIKQHIYDTVVVTGTFNLQWHF